MPSPKKWWKRTTSSIKDKYSILKSSNITSSIIKATSHDDRSIDYKHACRIFALAQASPSLTAHLMRAVARRAERTRSWPVALKSLLLAHGLLILTTSSFQGRLPFNLSDFSDCCTNSSGFSAFVRAYFNFLDHRAILLWYKEGEDEVCRVERMQDLLDLLMQICPCMNGMNEKLVIEAMDCAIVEMFEVCTRISDAISVLLVKIMDMDCVEERSIGGFKAIRVLKRANEQSSRLGNYLDVCKSLSVRNAIEFPGVEKIPDDVILDLETRIFDEIQRGNDEMEEEEGYLDWVIFEDDVMS